MAIALSGKPVFLNLGGAGEGIKSIKVNSRINGFLTVDLRAGPNTDIVSNADNLNMFDDDSVDIVYASQILEHFPIHRTVEVLSEWRRVLKKGSKLYVSVPDFDMVVELYRENGLTEWLVYHLWGDQKHPLNYHYVGFTFASLAKAIIDAGFNDVKRLNEFPFHVEDGSQNRDSLKGRKISLNVEAVK